MNENMVLEQVSAFQSLITKSLFGDQCFIPRTLATLPHASLLEDLSSAPKKVVSIFNISLLSIELNHHCLIKLSYSDTSFFLSKSTSIPIKIACFLEDNNKNCWLAISKIIKMFFKVKEILNILIPFQQMHDAVSKSLI